MDKSQYYTQKQRHIFNNANSRWNIFSGAVRSGKSFIGNDLIIKRLKQLPDGRRALIGKTETTIMRNILDPLRDIYPDKYISGIQGMKREAEIFGKKFYCIGANDARATKKLQGAGFIYAFGDEITTWPEGFFNMLKSRLDKEDAKFDGTCNPEGPYHWLKKGLIDRVGDLDVFHQHFTIDDNSFLPEEFVYQLKKEYSGVWYQRYIEGLWVLAEGLVYDMYDEDNLIEPYEVNSMKYTREWIGVDYGTTNDTVFVLVRLGEDDKLYIVDEYRWGEKSDGLPKTDVTLADDLEKFITRNDANPEWIFVDPSAKSFITEIFSRAQHFAPFYKVTGAKNDVLNGIQQLSSLLGVNKLLVAKGLGDLNKEFHSYSWDKKAEAKGEDKPLKEYDHGLDALRYVINGIPRVVEYILKVGD